MWMTTTKSMIGKVAIWDMGAMTMRDDLTIEEQQGWEQAYEDSLAGRVEALAKSISELCNVMVEEARAMVRALMTDPNPPALSDEFNGLEMCEHEWVDTTDFDSDHDEMTCIHCGWVTIVVEEQSVPEVQSRPPDERTMVEDELFAMVKERDITIKDLGRANNRLKNSERHLKRVIAGYKEDLGLKNRRRSHRKGR
jgi:hypothetical protein